jgi:general secretion pathway protein A
MYLSHFNLREFPFAITSDAKFFYESSVHAEALANMMYTAQEKKGMVLITGEVGAGKTFLANLLGQRLGPACLTVMMKSPPQSSKQLLRALATGAGIQVRNSADRQVLVDEFEQHLIRLQSRGRLVVLIVDEAQDLPAVSLEELRLLWNWENDGRRLVQIVLVGQPELRKRLLEPRWEPLRQRIVLSYHLGPLSRSDTAKYVRHRLQVAAEGDRIVEFTEQALDGVYAATNGIPRLINVLCDNAMLVGYARDAGGIDETIVNDVLRDMTCWGLRVAAAESPTAGA